MENVGIVDRMKGIRTSADEARTSADEARTSADEGQTSADEGRTSVDEGRTSVDEASAINTLSLGQIPLTVTATTKGHCRFTRARLCALLFY